MPQPVTEVERICVSFRDQSTDWSWESVIPLLQGRGERIATTSDIGHWFAMTGIFARGAAGRADVGIGPYGELQGVRYKAVGADDSVRPVHSFFPFRGDPHKKSPLL